MLEIARHYPKDWVVLQNKVMECFKGMTLDEKRLFLMTTPLARTTKISSSDAIFISSEEFANECGLDLSTAYSSLEQASNKLFLRFFSYVNSAGNKVVLRWVNKIVYMKGQGGTEIYFTDEILLLLREFDALNPYTKYKKDVVLKLRKDYSLDIYHLAKKNQAIGSFIISLDELFEQLGLPESYRDLSNLKRRVIEPSLKEITENTDIMLTYENVKRGRMLVGFKFIVKEKTAKTKGKRIKHLQDPDTPDLFHHMTPKQVAHFARLLAEDAAFGSVYAKIGQTSSEFAAYVARELSNPEKQREWDSYLLKLGYKSLGN